VALVQTYLKKQLSGNFAMQDIREKQKFSVQCTLTQNTSQSQKYHWACKNFAECMDKKIKPPSGHGNLAA
jgi:hypothetical protein